ncbi:hypothetical protein K466DRAFT_502252 [Polyporus arcularius HHB13444]|uniref:Uncharacterized protein n=1 Tax=Polyporus arcularius HHB13444 TaxID=1314778 RepID=A0A5C3NWD0_9APHY|nr:hypothetical protein K466DRAFT_502252 [Polyporus arcularius HHB13444]
MESFESFLPNDNDAAFAEDEDERDANGDLAEEVLGLPSDFTEAEREEYALEDLGSVELSIRTGLAFDQLKQIRLAVQHRAAQIEAKKTSVKGNKASAAVQQDIDKIQKLTRLYATRYNENYRRISNLRGSEYDATMDDTPGARLRVIDLGKDLAIANLAATRTLGDSKKTGSWIWTAFDPAFRADLLAVEFKQWIRAKADKHRADEFVSRTCAEFRFTRDGFGYMSERWKQAAKTEGMAKGKVAYAHKKAAMWSRKREQAVERYDASRREGVDSEKLDHTLVSELLQL